MAIRPVAGLNLGVSIGIPVYDALSPWWGELYLHGLALGLGALIGGGLSLILHRSHRRQRAHGQALRRSRQHLAQAQMVSRLGSWSFEGTGRDMWWSEQTYRLMGLPLSHKADLDLFLSRLNPSCRQIAADFFQKGLARQPSPPIDIILDHENGETRCCRCQYELSRNGDTIGTIQDLTEIRVAEQRRLELERRLLDSQKMDALGTLASGIAHDLNNSLVPVLGLSELVLKELPPAKAQLFTPIIIGAEHARDLVRRILDYARTTPEHMGACDLGEAVESACAFMRHALLPTVGVRVFVEGSPRIQGNRTQLQQIVTNLLTNSAQALGTSPGLITVNVKDLGNTALLEVIDDGPGMDKETMERVFEPFFTTKAASQGSGMGLAMVYQIVQRHSGEISVQSSPGAGAAFRLSFPMLEPQENPMANSYCGSPAS